jgi:hypothetical protein
MPPTSLYLVYPYTLAAAIKSKWTKQQESDRWAPPRHLSNSGHVTTAPWSPLT